MVAVYLYPLHFFRLFHMSIRDSGDEVDPVASFLQAEAVCRQDALRPAKLALKIDICDD